MSKTHSTAFLKRRKFLMVLPLLVLPFAAMAFWSLGGGTAQGQAAAAVSPGLNTLLPDAEMKAEKPQDKMSLYDLAQKDSANFNKQHALSGSSSFNSNAPLGAFRTDPSETAIQLKLAQIKSEISSPSAVPGYSPGTVNPGGIKTQQPPASAMTADVARLEALMKNMQKDPGAEDPEMKELNSLMDKILAVQNPELIRQQPKPAAVEADSLFEAIPAEIARKQKAVQGSVVELRLLDTLFVKGKLIPKGHAVFGLAEFSNQRLNLKIKNIRIGNQIIPVDLTVFDRTDSMMGINAPEAVLTDALNSGSSDAIGSLGIGAFDQNLGVQVAGAGIEAAKNLLTKRLKRVKQPLKAGYSLLLRNNQLKAR